MTEWCVVGRTVSQAELAGELTAWRGKAADEHNVYLFREGAVVSRFDWGNEKWLTDEQLEPLWIVRLFSPQFELFARRIDYAEQACWQLRIAADQGLAGQLAGAEPLGPVGPERVLECVLLLGQSTGEEAADKRTRFEFKPNRYRRAELCYPGYWPKEQTLVLVAERFQPPADGTIVCWQALEAAA